VLNFKKLNQRFRKKDGFVSFLFGLALVTIIFLICLLFQFLTFSTPSEIKQFKGRGTVQTYGFPRDKVFKTAIQLVEEKGFSIIELDEKEGYVIAAEGEFFYEGRIIALFFTSESSSNHTEVEIVSKFMALPSPKELILPRYSPSKILNDIAEHLNDSKDL
jgi:hypothetical protein